MKTYSKPSIEFIELKPEERLACESGGNSGCCTHSDPGHGFGAYLCKHTYPWGYYCLPKFIILWFCR